MSEDLSHVNLSLPETRESSSSHLQTSNCQTSSIQRVLSCPSNDSSAVKKPLNNAVSDGEFCTVGADKESVTKTRIHSADITMHLTRPEVADATEFSSQFFGQSGDHKEVSKSDLSYLPINERWSSLGNKNTDSCKSFTFDTPINERWTSLENNNKTHSFKPAAFDAPSGNNSTDNSKPGTFDPPINNRWSSSVNNKPFVRTALRSNNSRRNISTISRTTFESEAANWRHQGSHLGEPPSFTSLFTT